MKLVVNAPQQHHILPDFLLICSGARSLLCDFPTADTAQRRTKQSIRGMCVFQQNLRPDLNVNGSIDAWRSRTGNHAMQALMFFCLVHCAMNHKIVINV
jgi:hypothetical protein